MPSIGTTAELHPVSVICLGKRATVCFQTVLSGEFQPDAVMQVKSFFKGFGGIFFLFCFCFFVLLLLNVLHFVSYF